MFLAVAGRTANSAGVVGCGFELGIGVLAFVIDRLVRVCQSAIQLELGRG